MEVENCEKSHQQITTDNYVYQECKTLR